MIPELGQFALILALLLATAQFILPMLGAWLGDRALIAVARPAAAGQPVFVAAAIGILTYAFLSQDFSVAYVAQNSNLQLPWYYRFSAVWGAHEGSLLLWVLILNLWTVAVAAFSRRLPDAFMARVIAVLGFVSMGFLLFTLLTSNPFERHLPGLADGNDLNPLLQDPGLIIHPPMLYTGYVGFSVAFAFAIAALLGGELDVAWVRWARPWTNVAWGFLTFGIALGSWWAYYELGWGGWWFWDPVENASFMPWLVGTALIHSQAVTEKRSSFRAWTLLLAITAFSLSLLGTFLVRSGVLTSVHSFASDPERGMFILAFLIIVVGGSLALFAWRAPKVGLGGSFDFFSRESLLLANNVLFAVAAGTVLLGTTAPLIVDALVAVGAIGQSNKISVGAPYFNAIFIPIMTFVVFLMGIGPVAKWMKASIPDVARRVRWGAAVAVITAVAVPFITGHMSLLVMLGVLMVAWIVVTVAQGMWERLSRTHTDRSLPARIASLPRSFLGMQLAHFGVAVFIVGVIGVGGYEEGKDVRMDVGDTVEIGGYTFRFDGVVDTLGPNYEAQRGLVTVYKDGQPLLDLHPEKRVYRVQRQPMTEAGIDSGFFRHLFVALGEPAAGPYP